MVHWLLTPSPQAVRKKEKVMFKVFFLLSSVRYMLMPKGYFSITLRYTSCLGHFCSSCSYSHDFPFKHTLCLCWAFQIVHLGKGHDHPAQILTKEHFIMPCNDSKMFIFSVIFSSITKCIPILTCLSLHFHRRQLSQTWGISLWYALCSGEVAVQGAN